VASIILKWKKFGVPKTLLRVGRLAKLNNQGRRVLEREATKSSVTLIDRAPKFLDRAPPIRPLW
jgi:hypothetical protein